MELTSAPPLDSLMTARTGQAPSATSDPHAARKAAEEFEGFFIAMFVETMFSGIKTDGMFGGGHAEGVYRSLLNQEYGKAIAKTGGLGLADHIQREILKTQEVSS